MKIGPVFRSGNVLAAAVESSVFFKKADEYLKFQRHEAPVTFLANEGEYWVTGGEDKLVTVLKLDWEAREVNLVKSFVAGKKVVGGALSGNTLLYGDKHGDIWRADLSDLSQPPVFALGHQGVLEGMWLGQDLLTFDKEFKVKVSGFPDTYKLKQVLLGHSHNITSAVQHHSFTYTSDGSGQIFKWNDLAIAARANLNSPLVLFAHDSCLVAVTCEQVYLLDYDSLRTIREVQTAYEGVVRLLGQDLCVVSTSGQDIELHTLVIEPPSS
jgi:hypothetical protein